MKEICFGICLIISLSTTAQDNPFIPYTYTKYSADTSHYFTSVPHRISQEYVIPGDIHGNTKVYSRDGKLLAEIYRYFWEKETFLNNAGNTIASITYTSFLKDFDNVTPPIIVYKHGKLYRRYFLDELILKPKKGYTPRSWIYTNTFKGGVKRTVKIDHFKVPEYNVYNPDSTERLMEKRSFYTSGDTLFITTSEERVAVVDLNTGKIVEWKTSAYQFYSSGGVRPDSIRVIRSKQ